MQKPLGTMHQQRLRSKIALLGIYVLLSTCMTTCNKWILEQSRQPWLLTSFQSGTTVLCLRIYSLSSAARFNPDFRLDQPRMIGVSVLWTVNLALATHALAYVPASFQQIVQSLCPFFTVMLQRFVHGRGYSTATYCTLGLITAGLAVTSWSMSALGFSLLGLALSLTSPLCASLKTTASNDLMTRGGHSPPELAYIMASYVALISLGMAICTGEIGGLNGSVTLLVAINCLLAFLVSLTSTRANKTAGPLSIAVASNVKQMLTVLIGIIYYNERSSMSKGLGMAITFVGIVLYAQFEVNARRRVSLQPLSRLERTSA